MSTLRIGVVIALGILITKLFHAANGGLSLKRLTLVSCTYYAYFIMVYAGSALTYLGLTERHYIIKHLTESDISFTYWACTLSGIALGGLCLFWTRVLGIPDAREANERFFTSACVKPANRARLLFCTLSAMLFGAAATVYTFSSLGYVPVFELLRGGDASVLRGAASHMFGGSEYIRNIGMTLLAPLGNLLAFAQWRLDRTRENFAFFIMSGVVCLFSLTWDLEKAPIVYHLGYLFVLLCLTGGRVSTKGLALAMLSAVLLLGLSYYATSGTVPLELVNGPISRTMVTPVGTTAMHFHYFPVDHDFLAGSSLPTIFAEIVGAPASWARSGRVVMGLFNPEGVASGVAGTMNAFFIGEAYANWGMGGIVFSVLWVGTLVGVSQALLMRGRKTLFSVMVMIVLVKFQLAAFAGGFVDYLYSPSLCISLALVAFATLPSAAGLSTHRHVADV